MADLLASAPRPRDRMDDGVHDDPASGLTSDEAHRRLETFGPNAMPDTAVHPVRRAIEKLWAPVPWMLEAAIVLQLALGDDTEAAIVAVGLTRFDGRFVGLRATSRSQRSACWLHRSWETGSPVPNAAAPGVFAHLPCSDERWAGWLNTADAALRERVATLC